MKANLLLTLLLIITTNMRAVAQSHYNQTPEFLNANGVWILYDSLGLNFNNPSNLMMSSNMSTSGHETYPEGCASVADPISGDLIFYSNGSEVWNGSDHLIADGLWGNGQDNSGDIIHSTAQGVLIVPKIGEAKKYYLFSLQSNDAGIREGLNSKLYYSVVNMNMNNGNGGILPSEKNILLDSGLLSESMLAVPGNNCDIWLITHTADSAIFKAFHITEEGIDTIPVLSYTGNQIHGRVDVGLTAYGAYSQGQMVVSPNREFIAFSSLNFGSFLGFFGSLPSTGHTWGTILCKFDANTGQVFDGILIDSVAALSAAFSPNSQKLYISTTYDPNHPNLAPSICQFDLSNYNSTAIMNSKFVVHSTGGGVLTPNTGMLKLYNDTIYCSRYQYDAIDRINNPNLNGASCNYEMNAILFQSHQDMSTALPSEVVLSSPPDTFQSVVDSAYCFWDRGSALTLTPLISAQGYNYEWSNHSTNNQLIVFDTGTYWVRYNNGCHYRTDTFKVNGYDLNPVIRVDVHNLSTTLPYASYQWMFNGSIIPGATDSFYTVPENGDYQVIVSNGVCTDTSEIYIVNNVSINDVVNNRSIKYYPNPTADFIHISGEFDIEKLRVQVLDLSGKTLLKTIGSKKVNVGHLADGLYILEVSVVGRQGTLHGKFMKQ